MNEPPVRNIPKAITFLGPNFLITVPTKGDIKPLSDLCTERAAPVAALLHPNVERIASKKGGNPRQKTADEYH
tara:strand:+ start:17474 stop:17692 length:219 start_codon:yes stop_codon:yes gene_type:complete